GNTGGSACQQQGLSVDVSGSVPAIAGLDWSSVTTGQAGCDFQRPETDSGTPGLHGGILDGPRSQLSPAISNGGWRPGGPGGRQSVSAKLQNQQSHRRLICPCLTEKLQLRQIPAPSIRFAPCCRCALGIQRSFELTAHTQPCSLVQLKPNIPVIAVLRRIAL
ncbi:MAG: hypothetical protein RLZZ232_2038, partial [Planctomycetota bacterium]